MHPATSGFPPTLRRRRWLLLAGGSLVAAFCVFLLVGHLMGRASQLGHWIDFGFSLGGAVAAFAMLAVAWIELRRAAAALARLRDSEARFRLLMDQVPADIWTTDTGLRLTAVFGSLVQRLERPDLRTPGITLYDVLGTTDPKHPAIAAHLRALAGKAARYERVDGPLQLSCRVDPLRDDSGAVVGCAGVAVSVGERRAAERRSKLLAAALDSASDMISVTDAENRFVYVNEAFLRSYGYAREEVLGQTPALVNSSEVQRREVLAATTRGGWIGDLVNRRKDGAEFPVSLSTTAIRDPAGRLIGLLGVARDLTEQVRAEEGLTRYRALVESSDDAIIGLSLDATIESWNAGAERLYGYRAEEVIGQPYSILVPPRYADQLRITLEGLRRGERQESYETERIRKGGATVAVSVTASPIRDSAGQVVGISGIHRDVTDRKRAASMLGHLAAIVESSDDAIISTDKARVIRTWNPGAERLYGYTAAEAVGKNIDTLVLAPGAQAEVDSVAEDLAGGAAAVRYEGTRVRKDGSLVEVAATASEMRDASGVLLGYTSIVRDVTERRRMEEALRQSEAMFRLLTENASDIISRHAPDGTFLYVSPACRKVLGYDPQELVGRSPYEFIHPDDATAATPPREVSDLPTAYSVTFRMRRKDGTYGWFESLGHAERDRATGAVTEIDAVSRDVTDRMLVESQLRQQGEDLRALARHLDSVREEDHTRMARDIHDGLGQALTALRLDLSWLVRRLPEASAGVRQKIGAMTALVDKTIEAGRSIVAELRPPILDDLGLAPSLEWYLHRFAKRAGLQCEWDPGPAGLAVDREVAVIAYRVVQEALTNVARHARAKRVAVRLGEEAGALTVEIRDDGRGISEDAARSPRSLGIVGMRERALVRGGSLEVGPLPDGGTSVRLTIPIERRREPRAPR